MELLVGAIVLALVCCSGAMADPDIVGGLLFGAFALVILVGGIYGIGHMTMILFNLCISQ